MNAQNDIFFQSELSFSQLYFGQNNFQQVYSLQFDDLLNSGQNVESNHGQQMIQRRQRVSNNIFKTPLSEFRKMVLFQLKKLGISRIKFDQINQKKNMSTFLKLLLLVQHQGIKSEVQKQFPKKMEQLRNNKKDKVQEKRHVELSKIIERMQKSLQANDLQEKVSEYWGKYTQKSKFQECLKQLKTFQQDLIK